MNSTWEASSLLLSLVVPWVSIADVISATPVKSAGSWAEPERKPRFIEVKGKRWSSKNCTSKPLDSLKVSTFGILNGLGAGNWGGFLRQTSSAMAGAFSSGLLPFPAARAGSCADRTRDSAARGRRSFKLLRFTRAFIVSPENL